MGMLWLEYGCTSLLLVIACTASHVGWCAQKHHKSQSLLIGSRFCNWKHALERLSSHDESKENTDAFTEFHRRFKMAGAIDEQVEQYWKSVLKPAVSVIKFIAECGLAFTGDIELIESPGNRNYFGIREFIAQYKGWSTYSSCITDQLQKPSNQSRWQSVIPSKVERQGDRLCGSSEYVQTRAKGYAVHPSMYRLGRKAMRFIRVCTD